MLKLLRTWAGRYPLGVFLGLAFGWAWAWWLGVGLLEPAALPLAVLPGAWAPTLAAVAVTGLTAGRPGVRALVGRLLRWRVGLGWYAAVLLSAAGLVWAARGVFGWLGGAVPPMTLPPDVPPDAWPLAVPMIVLINLLVGGPLAEEAGWRGFALDRLRARYSTLSAALIVGGLWAAWHLPFYWLPAGAAVTGGLPLGGFALLVTAWSVLMAWLYANTRSLLLPVLLHAGANSALGTLGLLGQAAQAPGLLAVYIALNWLVVGVIVAAYGRELVGRRAPVPAATAAAPRAG